MWHYNAKAFKDFDGDIYYGIVEAYPDLPKVNTISVPHTQNEVTITGSSPEDLVNWLKRAVSDLEKYPPIED